METASDVNGDDGLGTASASHPEIRSYLGWSREGRSGFWSYLLGAVLSLFALLVLAGMGIAVAAVLNPGYQSSPIWANAALLGGFVVPFLAVPGIVRWVNGRPGWSVALPVPRYEGWNLWVGFGVATVVGLLCTALAAAGGLVALRFAGFDWGLLVPLAAIGLLGIFIQAAAEEMVFRGYLTQFARRFTSSPWLFIGIPAILFALPHAGNIAAYAGNPLVLAPYLISGVLYGWAAYRSGSLWLSTGLHLSNNLSGLILIGTAGDVIRTVAPLTLTPPSLPVIVGLVGFQSLVIALAMELLLRRRGVAVAPS